MNKSLLFIAGAIIIVLLVWLVIPGGQDSNERTLVQPTGQIADRPIVHTVALSEALSETVYLPTGGSGSRINWDIVEEDVPLITIINGKERYCQPPRNSPGRGNLVLNDKILSIAWAVPPGCKGTVTYTVFSK